VSALADKARGVVGAPVRAGFGFWDGLRYPFRGLRFVYVEHRGLARYWLVPLLLTAGALVAVIYGSVELHGPLTDAMWATPTGEGIGPGALRVLHAILSFVVGILLAAVGFVVVVALTTVFAAPFNDALSEEVERLRTGRPGPPFRLGALLRDIGRTVTLELVKLALYVAVMGPLFVLSLAVPGVGPIAYSVFSFLFTAMYFALDYIDWPVARRGLGLRYRRELLARRRATFLGFGTGVWLFLFIPLLNLFFMPAAVAGGTLLYLDLEGPAGVNEAPPTGVTGPGPGSVL